MVFTGIGRLKNYEVDFQLTEDATEFYHKGTQLPIHQRDATTARQKEYIATKIFEYVSDTEPIKYCSALLVIDEGKKIRLTGDCRKLNQFLKHYCIMPAPRVEDFREKMRCASYYLKTYMAKG